MPERSDRHGWIDLLVPDGPFLSAAALDVQTVGDNWPTRLSAEQRSLLTCPPASEAEEGEGWDDSSWDGRRARVTELLTELLGYREGKTLAVAPDVAAHHHIYRARVSADFVIHAPDDPDDVRMVVICGPDATDDPARLDPARTHTHDGWVSTPVQRAALLARHADAELALVTNGREHLLVNVVTGTTGSAMWTVNGLEDRHARDAFVALLHKQRVLHRTVPLSKLIELSQDRQHELTDTLGKQVRRAAEALVNSISRANRTSRARLLEGLTGQQVYAATTRVLMRTVFLLVAEERGLLPVAENRRSRTSTPCRRCWTSSRRTPTATAPRWNADPARGSGCWRCHEQCMQASNMTIYVCRLTAGTSSTPTSTPSSKPGSRSRERTGSSSSASASSTISPCSRFCGTCRSRTANESASAASTWNRSATSMRPSSTTPRSSSPNNRSRSLA
jgi:hypothetical protein